MTVVYAGLVDKPAKREDAVFALQRWTQIWLPFSDNRFAVVRLWWLWHILTYVYSLAFVTCSLNLDSWSWLLICHVQTIVINCHSDRYDVSYHSHCGKKFLHPLSGGKKKKEKKKEIVIIIILANDSAHRPERLRPMSVSDPALVPREFFPRV